MDLRQDFSPPIHKDAAGGLLKSMPVLIRYGIGLTLGSYLVSAAGNIVPGRPAFPLMPALAIIPYPTLSHPGKLKRQMT